MTHLRRIPIGTRMIRGYNYRNDCWDIVIFASVHIQLFTIVKKEDIFMEQRERLGSRLGFILLSAGCAIGCGNVWKFPWMCGKFGGGFLLIYLICLVILGLPVMTMEFALGRAAQASPVKMYQKLEKPGQK